MGCACKGSTASPSTIGAMLARRGRFHDPRQLASAHDVPSTKACGHESSACGCVPSSPTTIGAMLARRARFGDPRHLKKARRAPVGTSGASTGCGTVPVMPSTIGSMFSRASRFKGPTHVRGLGYQTVEDVMNEKLRINALLATISAAWNACWDGTGDDPTGQQLSADLNTWLAQWNAFASTGSETNAAVAPVWPDGSEWATAQQLELQLNALEQRINAYCGTNLAPVGGASSTTPPFNWNTIATEATIVVLAVATVLVLAELAPLIWLPKPGRS